MRLLTSFALALPLLATGAPAPDFFTPAAQAAMRPYPWCARYMMRGAAYNCGFATFEQCLANVSGIGGFCVQNNYYPDAVQKPPARKTRHKRHVTR